MKVNVILFDGLKQHVLMKNNEGCMHFIEGDTKENESPANAAYRILGESLGFEEEVIALDFVRQEIVTSKVRGVWNNYTTVGVLKRSNSDTVPEGYSWISTSNKSVFVDMSKTCSYYELIKDATALLENREKLDFGDVVV